MCVFYESFFFLLRESKTRRILLELAQTLSLVKCVVAFDVIRPHLGSFFLSEAPRRSDLLQIGKQSASTSLSFGFGFGSGFIIIIHKSRLARIAIDRSLLVCLLLILVVICAARFVGKSLNDRELAIRLSRSCGRSRSRSQRSLSPE